MTFQIFILKLNQSHPYKVSGRRWRRTGRQSTVSSRMWIHQAEGELSCPLNWWLFNEAWAPLLPNPNKETRLHYNKAVVPHCSLWQLQISDFIKTRNEIFFFACKRGNLIKANYSQTSWESDCCLPSEWKMRFRLRCVILAEDAFRIYHLLQDPKAAFTSTLQWCNSFIFPFDRHNWPCYYWQLFTWNLASNGESAEALQFVSCQWERYCDKKRTENVFTWFDILNCTIIMLHYTTACHASNHL